LLISPLSYEETEANKPKEFRFTLANDPQKSITDKDLARALDKDENYYSTEAISRRLAQLAKEKPKPSLGKTLYDLGEHIERRTKPNRTELDGITLLTAGANLTGSLIQATGLAAEIIQKSRSAAASKDKDIHYLWDDLEQAAQRIDGLQSRLKDVFTVASKTEELPKNTASLLNSSEKIEDEAELMADSVEFIGDRLRQLEEALDPKDPVSPLKIDRNLPMGEQLKSYQESFQRINERLDELERSIIALEKVYHPIHSTNGVVSAERFVRTWIDFFQAQGQATNQPFSLERDRELTTASGKIVELKNQGKFLRISDPHQKIPLFEATKTGDRWLVERDRLSPEEVNKILRLPQTASELIRNTKSVDLVAYLQNICTETEWKQGGTFTWRDYHIQVSPTSNDGTKTIKSFLEKSLVFDAEIDGSGKLTIHNNDIPHEDLKKIPASSTNRAMQKQETQLDTEPELIL
jgi:hypothetical protein